MGLDQLLDLTSNVAIKVLPIVGVVVLIYLAIFVKHLVVFLKSANTAAHTMSQTLDTANRQLETLDKPLHTLNELSETVDSVHEAGKHAVRTTLITIIENFSSIKDWALSGIKKNTCDEDEDDLRSD